ncbi:MAG: CvpA family protein [Pseudomonadota bacterium]
MNLFDIIVFAICISSSLMGLHKGLLRLSLSLMCFILSLLASEVLFSPVKAVVVEHISNIIAVNIISGIVSYLIAMLFFAFINNQLAHFISGISGGMIDRILGLGLGAARGLVICWIIFGAVVTFTSDAHIGSKTAKDVVVKIKPEHYPKWLTNSMSYEFISGSLHSVSGNISDRTLDSISMPSIPKELPKAHSEIIDKATHLGAEHIKSHISDSAVSQPSSPSGKHSEDFEKELEGLLDN